VKSLAGPFAITVLLSGCAADPFEKNYSPRPNSETALSNPRYEHPTGEAKIYACSGDAKSCNLRAQEEGYEYLGMSSFSGPADPSSREQIIKQAKKVGASMVLVQSTYKDTLSGVVPNYYNDFSSGGIGSGGSAPYSKYSTQSAQGAKMANDVPYTMIRYDTAATFWVHLDLNQVPLGIVAESLPEDVRARLRRNNGVIAVAVMSGTPAFNARILRNDIITKIGGEEVIDSQSFDKQLTELQGRKVDFEILRGDTPKSVTVTLNQRH
jgi:C-terminal processing protease CtpA/Prc